MQGVQQQFIGRRNPPRGGGAAGNRNANHDLARGNPPAAVVVDLEAQDIGWPPATEKAVMQRGHLRLTHQRERKLPQGSGQDSVSLLQMGCEKVDGMGAHRRVDLQLEL